MCEIDVVNGFVLKMIDVTIAVQINLLNDELYAYDALPPPLYGLWPKMEQWWATVDEQRHRHIYTEWDIHDDDREREREDKRTQNGKRNYMMIGFCFVLDIIINGQWSLVSGTMCMCVFDWSKINHL